MRAPRGNCHAPAVRPPRQALTRAAKRLNALCLDPEQPMPRHQSFSPKGVIPAVILPFKEDLSIDEAAFRSHLRDVAATPGISAITVNAHSTEAASCTLEEQARVMEIAQDEVGARLPIVHGIYAEGSLEGARIAGQAAQLGASALLVFPPGPFTMGHRPEMVIGHFQRVADAADDLPLIAFNYPLAINQGYTTDMLVRLAEAVPSVRAIKDWCNHPVQHERNVRVLQSLPRPVTVLSTHSAWLLSSLVLGCGGLLSGSGSVIPDLQAQLFAAVQRGDLAKARRLNDRIHPLAEVFYAAPAVDMHNRMKEALVLLGRQKRAVVRPPLMKIAADEVARIQVALVKAGLIAAGGKRMAAE
jgi:4-hydroxy-tetrahydrodipicolinate synthase